MKKTMLVVAAILGSMMALSFAGTQTIGTQNQQVNFGGVAQPVSQNSPPWSFNLTQVGGTTFSLGQQLAASSLPVVLTASQLSTLTPLSTVTANQGAANATPWNQNVSQFGGNPVVTGTGASGVGIPRVTVSNDSQINSAPLQLSTINKSSQTVTTTSVQFYASNAARRGFECVALPSNTDYVTCAWGSTALATDTIIITATGSYEPPKGIIPTNAFSCIANSGSQVIRCTEYATP